MPWQIIAEQEVHNDRPSGWFPARDAPVTILQARRMYDGGTHEMATRRLEFDGYSKNLLMIIERKKPIKRTPYFSRDTSAKANLTGVPSAGKVRTNRRAA